VVELRVVATAVLPKLGAHLVTALARLYISNLARRNSLESGSTREKKERGGAGNRKKLSVKVWNGKQKMPLARPRVSSARLLLGDSWQRKNPA
jgi:hypothetical protein